MDHTLNRKRKSGVGDETSLTQTLEKLSLPITPVSEDRVEEPTQPTVLLICRDGHSQKWGPRWLSQAGLAVTLDRKSVV